MRWFVALLVLAAPAAWAQATDTPLHAAMLDYARYQTDISTLTDAPISSQETLDVALARAAGHDPARVTRGWVAYGALTAAQAPAFVGGVRSRVRAAGRAPVIRQLTRDLAYARRRPPGAGEAIGLILASARADAARLSFAGERYNEVARTIELAGWSAPTPEARNAREARLRAPSSIRGDFTALLHVGVLGAQPLTDARAFGGAAYWDAIANRAPRPTPANTPAPAPARTATVDRMLTLAGLFIVNATSEQPARVSALLDDAPTRECLELELLQFRQCASVSHSGDEDAQCLALHGLQRPGMCFASIVR